MRPCQQVTKAMNARMRSRAGPTSPVFSVYRRHLRDRNGHVQYTMRAFRSPRPQANAGSVSSNWLALAGLDKPNPSGFWVFDLTFSPGSTVA